MCNVLAKVNEETMATNGPSIYDEVEGETADFRLYSGTSITCPSDRNLDQDKSIVKKKKQ